MNLIDILNNILDTKLQIKEIIRSEDYSNDISRYSTAIHNYLADLYNKGYKRGYGEKWLELTGNTVQPADKIAKWNYNNSDIYYSSYDVDVLTDIMKDVLNYRIQMKNEIDVTSNYFPDYPEYLKTKINSIDSEAYNAGKNDAANNYSSGISDIEPPTPSYDNNNVITITSQYTGGVIYFKLSADGVWNPYTDRIVIKDNVNLYVKQRYNGLESREAGPYNYTYNPNGYKPGEPSTDPDAPSGDNYQNINTPIVQQSQNTVSLTNITTNATTYVRLSTNNPDNKEDVVFNNDDWFVYNGPFNINQGCWIEAYSVRGNVFSGHAIKQLTFWAIPNGDGGTGTGTTNNGKVAKPTINCTNNVVVISTSTEGANLHYKVGSDGAWVVALSPVSFNITTSATVIAYATKTGLTPSEMEQVWCNHVTPDDGSGEPNTNPGQIVSDKPADPRILTESNTINILSDTEGGTIWYSLSGQSGFSVYNGPIPITETKTCIAYVVKDGKYSNTVQELCKYVDTTVDDPDQPVPVNPKPSAPTKNQEEGSNIVTLSTDLDEAIIKYQIGSNPTWYVYTDPIVLTSTCTIATYAYKEYDGGIKRYSDTVQYLAIWTNPNPQDDEPTIQPPVVKPSDPVIRTIDNVVYITCPTDGVNIRYQIAGTPGWNDYNSIEGIPITRTVTIAAYAVKDGKYSNTVQDLCEYVEPVVIPVEDLHPWVDACSVPTYDYNGETHVISFSTATEGATIYYQINDWVDEDGWLLYTGPVTLVEDCSIWAKATKEGYQDSFYLGLAFDLPEEVTPTPPPPPTISYANIDRTTVLISAPYGEVLYRYGVLGDWIPTNSSNKYLMPTEPVAIYAKTRSNDTGLESEETSFYFEGLEHMYTLGAPVIEFANNRFTITNPNSTGVIYYTTDNTSPYEKTKMYNNVSGVGVPYTKNTYVRAIVDGSSEDGRLYSKESAKWVVYNEDDNDWENEYFAIKGATEIHLIGNTNQIKTLQYSYDKINWTPFIDVVTGLDSSSWVYLNIYAEYNMETGASGGKQWDSMYFGPEDAVTMAGNPYTLVLNGRRFPEIPERVNIFDGMFKGCEQVVDAQNVYITIKEGVGYDLQYMFKDCVNLVYGPKIPYLTKLGVYSMYQTFSGCSKLERIDDIHINEVSEYSCLETFKDCSSLISFGNFDITSQVPISAFKSMFEGCTNLKYCWFKISGDITGYEACMRTFYGCSSLVNTVTVTLTVEDNPIKLLSANIYKNCYYQMFEGCSSLDVFGTIAAERMQTYACAYMFKDCASLVQAPILIATTLDLSCYLSMFENCVSLEKAPVLPALSLNGANHCYWYMFRGCSKLNYIKALFLDNIEDVEGGSPTEYTQSWVEGVAEYGTFEQNEDATWFQTGVNAIPEKWVASGAQGRVGKILDIESTYTTVTITADNDDRIYYRVNGGDWELYSGPFELFNKSYVEARCQNARGDLGKIYGEEVSIEIPKPIISQDGVHITISAPAGFEYDTIYFCVNHFDYGNNMIPGEYLETYSGPFDINVRSEISAYGVRNGYKSAYSHKTFDVVIPKPSIEVSNNIVTIKDNTGIEGATILYKLNDIEDSYSGWTLYTEPFLLRESDMRDGKITITAKSGVWSIGGTRYSELEIVDTAWDPDGANYILHVPVLKQWPDTNEIYLVYNGAVFQTWTNNDIDIMYRIGSSGTWTKYTNQFSIDHDCDIYIYATDGVQPSTTAMYHFEYNDQVTPINIPVPTYSITTIDNIEYLVLQNVMSDVENCYRIGNDPTPEMFYGSNNAPDWIVVPYSGRSLYPLKSGKIYIISRLTRGNVTYFSQEDSFDYVCGQEYEVKLTVPTVNFNRETNIVSILTSPGLNTYYRVDNQTQHSGILYDGPFSIDQDCTIHAWNVSIDDETKKSNEYSLFCDYKLNATIGINFDEDMCSITSSDDSVILQYSLDGNNWIRYTSPFKVLDGYTIYARGYKDTPTTREYTDTISRIYNDGSEYMVQDPEIECIDNVITISCATTGATIYYKMYGESSYTEYENPIDIDADTYIEAYATKDGINSATVSLNCIYVTPWTADESMRLDILDDGYMLIKPARFMDEDESVIGDNRYFFNLDVEYKLNDGEWTEGSYSGWTGLKINVERGDVLLLRKGSGTYPLGINGIVRFNASGYARSFRNGGTRIEPNYSWELFKMFRNSMIVDASNLIVVNGNNVIEAGCANMFSGCEYLTAAPRLTATTLAPSCYSGMFSECTSLTTAPELPAKTLVEHCYDNMFYGCSSLNNVICYALNPGISNNQIWLYGVATTGTFTQSPDCTKWSRDDEIGIPVDWTVINYVAPDFSDSNYILAQESQDTPNGNKYIIITFGNTDMLNGFSWEPHYVRLRVKNNLTGKYIRPKAGDDITLKTYYKSGVYYKDVSDYDFSITNWITDVDGVYWYFNREDNSGKIKFYYHPQTTWDSTIGQYVVTNENYDYTFQIKWTINRLTYEKELRISTGYTYPIKK